MESRIFRPESLESIDPGKSQLINFDKIIKNEKLDDVAEIFSSRRRHTR